MYIGGYQFDTKNCLFVCFSLQMLLLYMLPVLLKLLVIVNISIINTVNYLKGQSYPMIFLILLNTNLCSQSV